MKRHAHRSVNIRKMMTSFFLVLVLFISFNTVVSDAADAEEVEEITAYPGQTITNNKLGFKNIGVITFYKVYANASGEAADWVSPTKIYFGTVYPGEELWKTYTIKVPEDAILGQDYSLIWDFYSEEGYADSVYHTIHVRSQLVIPWIWIVIILVLVIATPGIVTAVVTGVVVGRKHAREKPVTRICPQCGRPLPPDVKFCPYCGKTLRE